MASQADQLFGKIAIKNGLITEDDFQRACKVKEQQAPDKPIGLVLIGMKLISKEQYGKIAGKHREICEKRGIPLVEADAASPAPKKKTRKGKSADAAPAPKKKARKGKVIEATATGKKQLTQDVSNLAGGKLDGYLRYAVEIGASDLHLHAGSIPFVRLNGEITLLNHPVLEAQKTMALVNEALPENQKEEFQKEFDSDFCLAVDGLGRFRTNIFRERLGPALAFRIIEPHIRTLEELGLPRDLSRFCDHHQGIVLITGPAGCGKTATMAALIDIINKDRKEHVISIEDPIEYEHDSLKCNVTQREIGRDTNGYQIALRASLREDPDIIVVGELRDLETTRMAITAAETGHLVFGTLHTTGATRSVDRVLDIFPPKEQNQIRAMVSESLRGVISQQLIPRADGRGRVPAIELMFATPAVANLIREFKTFQLPSVMQTGKRLGMRTMDDSLAELFDNGVISKETAKYYAEDQDRF
ncbi:MAG: type IV pilus twitching motility protein PilT [Planctomycetota bacterium]